MSSSSSSEPEEGDDYKPEKKTASKSPGKKGKVDQKEGDKDKKDRKDPAAGSKDIRSFFVGSPSLLGSFEDGSAGHVCWVLDR